MLPEAFVSYFRLLGSREFYVPRADQLNREHPVGWLRVRSLLEEVSSGAAHAWSQTATLLKINEDYEGTWSQELFDPLQKTLDDMLVESDPRQVSESEARGDAPLRNPVAILNRAWKTFQNSSAGFDVNESALVGELLGSNSARTI